MKLKFPIFLILIFSIFPISGCLVAFYGSSPRILQDDLQKIKVYWNSFSGEPEIAEKLFALIKETYTKYGYADYWIFYQSNNNYFAGKRTYIIKFFRSEADKKNFIDLSFDRLKSIKNNIESGDFHARWKKLKEGMLIEDVIKQIPEIVNADSRQEFFEHARFDLLNYSLPDYSVLELNSIKMYFSGKALLKKWELTGNSH